MLNQIRNRAHCNIVFFFKKKKIIIITTHLHSLSTLSTGVVGPGVIFTGPGVVSSIFLSGDPGVTYLQKKYLLQNGTGFSKVLDKTSAKAKKRKIIIKWKHYTLIQWLGGVHESPIQRFGHKMMCITLSIKTGVFVGNVIVTTFNVSTKLVPVS